MNPSVSRRVQARHIEPSRFSFGDDMCRESAWHCTTVMASSLLYERQRYVSLSTLEAEIGTKGRDSVGSEFVGGRPKVDTFMCRAPSWLVLGDGAAERLFQQIGNNTVSLSETNLRNVVGGSVLMIRPCPAN